MTLLMAALRLKCVYTKCAIIDGVISCEHATWICVKWELISTDAFLLLAHSYDACVFYTNWSPLAHRIWPCFSASYCQKFPVELYCRWNNRSYEEVFCILCVCVRSSCGLGDNNVASHILWFFYGLVIGHKCE